MRPFRPQTDYLAIISFWPDGAVAVRGRLAAGGRWADRWKEWIDRRFIARYR
jgi:selenide,water dikinase